MKTYALRLLATTVVAAAALMLSQLAFAQGECSGGACGTPYESGGGGGCGCGGGSILINNTDMGETYSTSDDYDNDGLEDDFDNCPWVANTDQADADGDGIGSACDNCPDVSNAEQGDLDGDGLGDACDADKDGDGVPNDVDTCPTVPNPSQNVAACDPNAPGAGQSDEDGDGVPDAIDNAPGNYNPEQGDVDGDGVGDVADADADADGIPNTLDNAWLVANPDQKDVDHDGIGDAADPQFCYVYDPHAACLDPSQTFQVGGRAASKGDRTSTVASGAFATGEDVGLHLYANRKNTPIRYTWAVTSRPDGSSATISHSWGTAVYSGDTYEYRYHQGEFPTFTPDQPGSYQI